MCVLCVHGGFQGAWVRSGPPHDLPDRQLVAGRQKSGSSSLLAHGAGGGSRRVLQLPASEGAMRTARRVGTCASRAVQRSLLEV
jgi:hypothetical protein